MMQRISAIAGKELKVLFRDRGTLAVLFLLPMILSTVFGNMLQGLWSSGGEGTTVRLPVVLVNSDGGRFGRQVADTLGGVSALNLMTADSETQANDMVAAGDALAAVIIPPDFTSSVEGYVPTTVKVIGDPTQAQYIGLVTGVVNDVLMPVALEGELRYGIGAVMAASPRYEDLPVAVKEAMEAQSLGAVMTQLQRQQASPWIGIRAEDLEGLEPEEPTTAFDFTVPALTVMFAFFLVGVVGHSLWVEKEQGSLRRLLASPASKADVIGGKVLAFMLVVCLQVLVFFTIGSTVFGMNLGRSAAGLAALTVSLAFVSTSLGMLVAAVSRSSKQADNLGTLLAFILAAVGGCIGYPIFQLGGIIGFISRLTPHAHALMGYLDLFFGGTLADVLPQIGVLLLMGVVMFAVAVRRFQFE